MEIVPFDPLYATHFERLNKAWLEKYFYIEPIDEYVLANPQEAILDHGGKILFAKHQEQIIGTIAMKWQSEGVIELTKMGVDEAFQGLGAGKLLFETALTTAIQMGAHRIILYSNTILAPALSIYRKYGFVEVPLEKGLYERSDIKMELPLTDSI